LAKPNDFLIIDEPELNLHPDNQRKIARVLAQMVNAGIKVMISTHSDYVIRELNNLMMLHTKDNEKQVNQLMKKYGYQKDQILDHNKVGAYLFTSEVKALEITNTGFEVKTIDDEINQLNNSANDIFFTLHDND
jgi:predicted ATPase